jgi:FixJ family two-component response regulator
MAVSSEQMFRLDSDPVVFVVDHDISVRESLGILIRGAGWKPELFASAQSFLDCTHVNAPRCLILDVALPDLSGLDVQKIVAIDQPHMPVIFITGHGDISMSVRAMKAGAFEFLTKPVREDVVRNAIQQAIDHSHAVLHHEVEMQALRDRYALLTYRQREIMSLVASGMSNKQIGDKLGISVITVKAHRGQAMRKMKAGSLADLVKMEARLARTPAPKG